MNDKQRNEIDESKLAQQTALVLESDQCTDQAHAATHELGRLLRQSAKHDLPESNQDLREQMLATLASEEEPAVSLKSPLEETSGPVTRRRLWIGLAASALVAGGCWLYQPDLGHAPLSKQSALNAFDGDSVVPPSSLERRFETPSDSESRLGLVLETNEAKDAMQDAKVSNYSFNPIVENEEVGGVANSIRGVVVITDGAVDKDGDGVVDGEWIRAKDRDNTTQFFATPTPTSTVVSVPNGGTVLLGGVKRSRKNHRFHFNMGVVGDDSRRFQDSAFFSQLGDSSGEQYTAIYENAFVKATGGAAISTFSIDVDTASYANMRRFLNSGQTPPRDSIRIEELVNYFQYDYPQPKGEDPFSVNMELASCPWSDSHKLLRVGLKGKEVHVQERPPTNVVFLMDVSGSMNSADKLPLLKRGFQMMVKQLGENDRVSIVTYAGNAGVALEPTTGDNTKTINEAIERLTPGGSTHGSAGIELAYKLAQQHFITGGVNKVILATDGDLNVGVTSDGALVDLIKQKASEGVFLTVLGFGTGNLKDGKLEKLADNGNGHYAYIDSDREAHRVLVQQLSASLVTIAKDVKIQIEFNPAEVKSYRLVGYENRMLATEDFANDRKDAGEIGAGHTVTAIYEIEPMGAVAAALAAPQGMKYQVPDAKVAPPKNDGQKSNLSDAAKSGELATVALRYKQPDENTSKRIEFTIENQEKSFTSASDDFRFAASVAGFGMLLRDSTHAGTATPQMILKMASQSMGDDTTGYRAEFVDLVRKAFAR